MRSIFVRVLALTNLVVSFGLCVSNETKVKGRIINGRPAFPGQFPYVVSLEVNRGNKYFLCAGSFIGKEWILSAAHCLEEIDYVIVYLGTTTREIADVSYVVYPPEVIIHPHWIPDSVNDIALIHIPPTQICENVFPVPLPAMTSYQSTYEGCSAFASGWGAVDYDASDYPSILQWARLTVMSNRDCALRYRYITVADICTHSEDATCNKGDSGGPLVSEDTGTLIGMTSRGVEENGVCTMIYTRVSFYLPWIKSITGISY